MMGNFFFRLILPVIALVAGVYVARHAFSEAMHTVIASQPPIEKVDSPTFGAMPGCALDSQLRYENELRCKMEMRAAAGEDGRVVLHAKPPLGMTKAESETASGWFMLAAFAIPLSLLIAAGLGFLVFRAASEKEFS
jgi:hypothetical protein